MFNTFEFNNGMFNESKGTLSNPIGVIQYNGMDLPNAIFGLSNIPDMHDISNISLSTYDIAGSDGGGESNYKLKPKSIKIMGYIQGSTPEQLEANIRSVQSVFVNQLKPFYYRTRDGKILYELATCISCKPKRNQWNMTYIPCDITLLISKGTMRELQPQEVIYSGVDSNNSQALSNVHGTWISLPVITYLFKEATGVTSLEFTVGTKKMIIKGVFETDDVILIDSYRKIIQKNGVTNKEYIGEFPELSIGDNIFTNNINGTFEVDIIINWLPTYV